MSRPKHLTTIRQARCSSFMRGLLCTLLVAFPASAEPITGLDNIQLGAGRKLRLVVGPEPRCVFGDMEAIAARYAQNGPRTRNPAATELLLTIEPLVRSSFRPVVESMSLTEVDPNRSFVLPRTPDRTLAGVFICMAERVKERCAAAATRRSYRTTAAQRLPRGHRS